MTCVTLNYCFVIVTVVVVVVVVVVTWLLQWPAPYLRRVMRLKLPLDCFVQVSTCHPFHDESENIQFGCSCCRC
jgi:hypothetical protein